MNIESRTDDIQKLRTHIIRGEIDPPGLRNFLTNLYLARDHDPDFHALWDLREAGFSAVTPTEIKEMAYFARVNWAEKHRRRTAVVISGDFQFGLSRMFEQYIGPSAHGRIRTFRDCQAAVDWIEGKVTAIQPPTIG